MACNVCRLPVETEFVEVTDYKFHNECFLCVQCLGPFPNGDFIEHGGFLYCPSHFHRQFGDRCAACFEIIDGGFVNAIDKKWHKNHFNCYQCDVPLQTTFVAMHGHPFCKTCHLQIKNRIQGKPCSKCDKLIFPNDLVMRHNGKDSHLHHFECVRCLEPLKADYKLWDKQFYCQKDYAKLNFINCDVCSKPIEGRNIEAIGKHFHPEHFVCCKCEIPFKAHKFYDFKGQLYCETHFNEKSGSSCRRCGETASGQPVRVQNNYWCSDHFLCTGCDCTLDLKKKTCLEWDGKPFCKKCYDHLPADTRRLTVKYNRMEAKLLNS